MRVLGGLFLGLMLFGCSSSNQTPKPDAASTGSIAAKGTIRHLDLEGGFWGIVADDSTKYDPVELPGVLEREGLRVKFTAREAGGMSTRMWGKRIDITSIEILK